jgi:hypothetical protein
MSEPFDGKPLEWSDRNLSKGPMSFRGVPLQLVDEGVEFTAFTTTSGVHLDRDPYTLLVDGKYAGEFTFEYVGTKRETGKDGQPVTSTEYRLTKVEQSP